MSEASFDEARRNLDANDSVVRVAAVSKLENLSDVDAHRDLVSMLKKLSWNPPLMVNRSMRDLAFFKT